MSCVLQDVVRVLAFCALLHGDVIVTFWRFVFEEDGD